MAPGAASVVMHKTLFLKPLNLTEVSMMMRDLASIGRKELKQLSRFQMKQHYV
jgi:hypothetical protein